MAAAVPTMAGTLATNERRELMLFCCDKPSTNWGADRTANMAMDKERRLIRFVGYGSSVMQRRRKEVEKKKTTSTHDDVFLFKGRVRTVPGNRNPGTLLKEQI